MDHRIKKEISRCILCHNAACSAGENLDVSRILRALYFDNLDLAASMLPDDLDLSSLEPVEAACP